MCRPDAPVHEPHKQEQELSWEEWLHAADTDGAVEGGYGGRMFPTLQFWLPLQ
jgi:hypothetical protein